MKRVWFIRHGQHDWIGKALVGRKGGVGLNALGQAQARAIAQRLDDIPLAAIYASPQRRAFETAVPLAKSKNLPIRVAPDLDEIDFGDWIGMSFRELETDPRWRRWNEARSTAGTPGGETMSGVQKRILRAIDNLSGPQPVAFVTHGDVIKAAMTELQGLSLDAIHSLEVEPGALVMVEIGNPGAARVEVYPPEELRELFPASVV